MPSGLIFAIVVLVVYGICKLMLEIYTEKEDKKNAEEWEEKYKNMSQEEKDTLRKECEKKEEALHAVIYGQINLALICPHCQNRGKVRSKEGVHVTKTHVNSLPAKVIGLGTTSEKNVTQLRCDKCNMSWEI